MMLRSLLSIICGLTLCVTAEAQPVVPQGMTLPRHPRLLLSAGKEDSMRAMLGDATWLSLHQGIIREAQSFAILAPVLQAKIGKRLLDKSRECLRRVFFLSYAWRMTNDRNFLQRAEREMLAVAAFTDWNPSHFLDVAEMTLAMAIGYDWLYDGLSQPSRDSIRKAIIQKGLLPSMEPKNNGWLRSSNNWNQVCNTGMAYGAMAVYENVPDLAHDIINRSVSSITVPMKEYAPDGNYPEGYNYWGYGTSFNVLLISALETVFGTDFGLSNREGFLATGSFLTHMVGPVHRPFNYFDAGPGEELHPALCWFASRTNDPSVMWMEKKLLQQGGSKKNLSDRLLPAIMIWGRSIEVKHIAPPEKLYWKGTGANPVVMMRSSWTDTAVFVACKGGSPSLSHGHMDAGSFILDAGGVRWAMDPGMQEYESLESKGVDLWNMRQYSQRWSVFRYNNYAHNTLTVNDSLQRVSGHASLLHYNDSLNNMSATWELGSIYKEQLTQAKRTVSLRNSSEVVISDETDTGEKPVLLRWTLVTAAKPRVIDAGTIALEKDGKTMLLRVHQAASFRFRMAPADPVHLFDAPNPGVSIVMIETELPANYHNRMEVHMQLSKR